MLYCVHVRLLFFRDRNTDSLTCDSLLLENERFDKTFTDCSFLGKGKYGTVYKAKFKIDRKMYAIKIITFRSRETFNLKEVQRLASIKNPHENIVSYITAWLEDGFPKIATGDDVLTSGAESASRKPSFGIVSDTLASEYDRNNSREDKETENKTRSKIEYLQGMRSLYVYCYNLFCNGIPLQSQSDSITYNDGFGCYLSGTVPGPNMSMHDIKQPSDLSLHLCSDSSTDHPLYGDNLISLHSDASMPFNHGRFLFIQMHLCKMNLQEWLTKGRDMMLKSGKSDIGYEDVLRKDWITATNVFQTHPGEPLFKYINGEITNRFLEGIANGLNYIHHQKLAHHDLHIENVLVDIDDISGLVTPRISDFGLSATLASNVRTDELVKMNRLAAQLEITEDNAFKEHKYSFFEESKDDMKNLATIIFKLYYPAASDADVKQFSNRNWKIKRVCPLFTEHWPFQAKWIEKLTSEDRVSRPTSAEILYLGKKDGVFRIDGKNDALNAFEQITKLEYENDALEKKICKINQEKIKIAQEKDAEIQELKRQIAEMMNRI